MVGGADAQSRFSVCVQTANNHAGHTSMIALISLMAALRVRLSAEILHDHQVAAQ